MFLTNLSLGNVNPKKDVLDSISLRHFSAIDSVPRSIELSVGFYTLIRDMPSTKTVVKLGTKLQLHINGPFNTSTPNILIATGIDEVPYVKLLRVDYGTFFDLQHKEIIQEKSVVVTLELNSPPCALVRMELISVKLNDREPDIFSLKMPRYLTVLSDYTKMWTYHLIREGLRLVEAVEYMHSRNVVHMDIKESNIFV